MAPAVGGHSGPPIPRSRPEVVAAIGAALLRVGGRARPNVWERQLTALLSGRINETTESNVARSLGVSPTRIGQLQSGGLDHIVHGITGHVWTSGDARVPEPHKMTTVDLKIWLTTLDRNERIDLVHEAFLGLSTGDRQSLLDLMQAAMTDNDLGVS
jgi:hypothetical protein